MNTRDYQITNKLLQEIKNANTVVEYSYDALDDIAESIGDRELLKEANPFRYTGYYYKFGLSN